MTTGSIAYTIETLEDVIEVLGAYTNPLVNNTHKVIAFPLFQPYCHLPTLWRVLHRIIQDISNDLTDTYFVSHNFRVMHLDIQKDCMLFRARLCGAHTCVKHINVV